MIIFYIVLIWVINIKQRESLKYFIMCSTGPHSAAACWFHLPARRFPCRGRVGRGHCWTSTSDSPWEKLSNWKEEVKRLRVIHLRKGSEWRYPDHISTTSISASQPSLMWAISPSNLWISGFSSTCSGQWKPSGFSSRWWSPYWPRTWCTAARCPPPSSSTRSAAKSSPRTCFCLRSRERAGPCRGTSRYQGSLGCAAPRSDLKSIIFFKWEW